MFILLNNLIEFDYYLFELTKERVHNFFEDLVGSENEHSRVNKKIIR